MAPTCELLVSDLNTVLDIGYKKERKKMKDVGKRNKIPVDGNWELWL